MCQYLDKVHKRLAPLKAFAHEALVPVVILVMRLVVGKVFLTSGWLKFGYVLNGQLDTLYFLFEDYKVPLLSTHVAAWMGMGGELGFGFLLTFGLFGRLGALGLIFMSAVIFHTDGNPQAVYWALICALVAVHGPGKWSLDRLIWKHSTDKEKNA